MPYKEGQPLLMEFFAGIPFEQVVRKKLFGKRYMRMFDYAQTLSFQYEAGALLGRIMRDKLDIFHKMLVKPGTDINRSIAFMQSEAKDRLKKFTEEEGKEPDTFWNFVGDRELEEASRVMGLSMGLFTDNVYSPKSHRKDLRKLWGHELALDDAYRNILNCGLYGLGFGSSFPELTEKMYRSHENIDMDKWSEARSHGLDIPEKPDFIPLEEREKEILAIVAGYTGQFYPELLDPLDLRGHLEI